MDIMTAREWKRVVRCEALDDCDDEMLLSADEVFDMVLEYEGIIGYSEWIKNLFYDIYVAGGEINVA